VGIANAFNLIDGMDGLASGAALFSSLVILIISISQGQPLMTVVALVLCGALAGFLRYNFNPASIFLGDSGALFVGFTLAALSVLSAQKATTTVAIVIPILAFGFPVVDTAMTMGRRLISRHPIFQGDNEHIHHMLLARGWSQRRVVLALLWRLHNVRSGRHDLHNNWFEDHWFDHVRGFRGGAYRSRTSSLSRNRRTSRRREAALFQIGGSELRIMYGSGEPQLHCRRPQKSIKYLQRSARCWSSASFRSRIFRLGERDTLT
jgi:membrane associated rhomboid family serine protease